GQIAVIIFAAHESGVIHFHCDRRGRGGRMLFLFLFLFGPALLITLAAPFPDAEEIYTDRDGEPYDVCPGNFHTSPYKLTLRAEVCAALADDNSLNHCAADGAGFALTVVHPKIIL